MKDFYKYPQINQDFHYQDLIVVNSGHTEIRPGSVYPSPNHPPHHYFIFLHGRVLEEYQLIYISMGKGILETKSGGKHPVTVGDVILLFPEEWHRYRPDEKTGWTENWVGFTGNVSMLNNGRQNYTNPVFLKIPYSGKKYGMIFILKRMLKSRKIDKQLIK